jgi:hypothetical protein
VALELARALGEQGLVEVEGGVARPASAATIAAVNALPGTVEGVVLGRVDRLGALAQRALKVASVIGRVFSWSTLQQALKAIEGPGRAPELLPALGQLERAGLVESLPDGDEPAWAFRSALVQEVVYNLMPSEQRRELHYAVAEWLEFEASVTKAPDLALLAHHWVRSGRMLRAQPYLEQAAEAALRAGAWTEAARLYGMLLHTDEGLAADAAGRLRQAGWRRCLGAAEAGAGRIPEARRHVEAALERLGHPTGGSLLAVVLGTGTREVLRRAAPFLLRERENPTLAEATRAYERLAELHYLSDAPVDAFREAVRGLERALRTRQEGVRVRLQAAASLALSVAPFRRLADPLIADAVACARATGEPDTIGWVLELAALQAFAVGRWADTAEQLDEALALSERAGDRRRALELRTLRGWALLTRGELQAAGPFFAGLERDAASEGDARSRAAAGTGLALAALRTAEVARVSRSSRAAGRPRSRRSSTPSSARRGGARRADGGGGAGRARPNKCWGSSVTRCRPRPPSLLREDGAGLEPGERARLAGLTRGAVAATRRFARVLPSGGRGRPPGGGAAWLDGRADAARAAWDLSLVAARRLDMPYDEDARSSSSAATPHPARATATGTSTRAAALFDELGALDDRARVERARRA